MRPRCPAEFSSQGLKTLELAADTWGAVTPLTLSKSSSEFQYVRVCFGGETSEPWMTLYEIDANGGVHRHVQVHAEGCRFAPEDILMCSPVNTDSMLTHPSAEVIDREMFELLWSELEPDREFLFRVPNPEQLWEGYTKVGEQRLRLMWNSDGIAVPGWTPVPGFESLFVQGSRADARRVCAAVFMDRPIRWNSMDARVAA